MLKPQDLYVLLKIAAGQDQWSYESLARQLHLSRSQVYASVKHCEESKLLSSVNRKVRKKELLRFLLNGVPYVYPARRGTIMRGMKTSFAAPPMNVLIESDLSVIPVWNDPHGEDRGYEIEPLYRNAPLAAREDRAFYELLALVDTLREGRAREREIAATELELRLQ